MTETSNIQSQSQPPVLQGNSTINTENMEAETSLKKEELIEPKKEPEEKSSISVYFKDWVPAEGSESELESIAIQSSEENYAPLFSGTGTRYFQLQRGQGKIRPGLGTNLEDLILSKPKAKKRKKPPMMELLSDTGNINKRFIITPEKPASAMLHEINPTLDYQYQEIKIEGSKGMPSFSCSVTFPPESGEVFVGEGRSKKLAKNDVAEKVLASVGVIIPPKNDETTPDPMLTPIDAEPEFNQDQMSRFFPGGGVPFQPEMPMMCNDLDFASDDIINVNFSTQVTPMLSQPMVDAGVFRRLRNIPNFEENICLALNTIVLPENLQYEHLGEDGPPHEITVKLVFNDQEYIGTGGSKKKAKADAAKKAVITLLGLDCYLTMVNSSLRYSQSQSNSSMEISPNTGESKSKKSKKKKKGQPNVLLPTNASTPVDEDEDDDDGDDWGEYDLNFSDHIANLVREKYEELMGKDSNFSPYKVLAGVVMTNGSPMLYNAEVIAVTTGTKCIDGDCLSEQGLSVNDCHAEILATRCVRDYLYSQIELFETAKTHEEKLQCILEENPSPVKEHKYQLKSDVKFHLYISTSPCGDARIFSPKGIEIEEDQPSPTDLEDTHPNKMNRGVLRSKIEAGEGTIPAANLYNGPQTWDSIVSGNALYTMSCSDKVCRWNVLGLQGALLYNFIGTVFYSSITLGSLHHPVHFKRAVYGRIELLTSRLEIPFHIHKPKLMMVSREEKRHVKKSPNHAVCWCIDWSTPEILAASKGRCEGGVASRFLKLYQNDSGRRENYVDLTYHEEKCIATDYQKAKKQFVEFFQESKLGPWIGKPLEQDSFKIK